jgi:hypothetical protein
MHSDFNMSALNGSMATASRFQLTRPAKQLTLILGSGGRIAERNRRAKRLALPDFFQEDLMAPWTAALTPVVTTSSIKPFT